MELTSASGNNFTGEKINPEIYHQYTADTNDHLENHFYKNKKQNKREKTNKQMLM